MLVGNTRRLHRCQSPSPIDKDILKPILTFSESKTPTQKGKQRQELKIS